MISAQWVTGTFLPRGNLRRSRNTVFLYFLFFPIRHSLSGKYLILFSGQNIEQVRRPLAQTRDVSHA